ncbi:MAG: NADH-quinone oxidoreductase subunit C [Acidobacteria bacterium]|nr:NADH-quinone oxidoreductase subunit C [Acidobacteriota bacterium]
MARSREWHATVAPADLVGVAGVLLRDCGTALILVAAEDARADAGMFRVHYLFAHHQDDWFAHVTVPLAGDNPEVPSLAMQHYPASRFEREMRDLMGIVPAGHPDPRPLARHGFWPEDYFPLRKDAPPPDFRDDGQPFPFGEVGGEGVYEIPVGPVHAGIIEPGHFRFSAVGETIIDVKQRLYFTHKGTEKLFEGQRPADAVRLAERVSGDSTVGHALAFCQAVESASGTVVPPHAQNIRVVLLELERLYNHVADFGMIVSDTGFALAHAHGYRIRERLLRLNHRVTGSRLLRGGIVAGGVACEVTDGAAVRAEVDGAVRDFLEVVDLCLANSLVADRLEQTGVLPAQTARDHGVRGFVARASGLDVDARRDHPRPPYDRLQFEVPVFDAGDVRARAMVRVEEVQQSARLIAQAIDGLPAGPLAADVPPIPAFTPAFAIVEGWRGAIVHWVSAGRDGRLHRVKIVDPSFLNWPALSRALVDNIVPDFPLCNKSFNQSYSGNDL